MTPHRYAYIDAMRGYAILLVIAVHSSQYVGDLSYAVRTLADQGAVWTKCCKTTEGGKPRKIFRKRSWSEPSRPKNCNRGKMTEAQSSI